MGTHHLGLGLGLGLGMPHDLGGHTSGMMLVAHDDDYVDESTDFSCSLDAALGSRAEDLLPVLYQDCCMMERGVGDYHPKMRSYMVDWNNIDDDELMDLPPLDIINII